MLPGTMVQFDGHVWVLADCRRAHLVGHGGVTIPASDYGLAAMDGTDSPWRFVTISHDTTPYPLQPLPSCQSCGAGRGDRCVDGCPVGHSGRLTG